MDWDRDKERKAGKAMGIGASIYAVIFAVAWNVIAAASGGGFMLIFGLPFLGFMIFRLVILLKKSKAEKPADPWEQTQQPRSYTVNPEPQRRSEDGFCPYCGEEVKAGFTFCPKCSRRLQ